MKTNHIKEALKQLRKKRLPAVSKGIQEAQQALDLANAKTSKCLRAQKVADLIIRHTGIPKISDNRIKTYLSQELYHAQEEIREAKYKQQEADIRLLDAKLLNERIEFVKNVVLDPNSNKDESEKDQELLDLLDWTNSRLYRHTLELAEKQYEASCAVLAAAYAHHELTKTPLTHGKLLRIQALLAKPDTLIADHRVYAQLTTAAEEHVQKELNKTRENLIEFSDLIDASLEDERKTRTKVLEDLKIRLSRHEKAVADYTWKNEYSV